MEKVSVIIPVYNVEQYLAQCIESVQNQSYSNLEIILVIDGANDHSLQIALQHARKDKRIRVVEQENSGRSVARNTGISIATGDYYLFIDGDDFIGPDHIKNLYSNLKRFSSDIACSMYYRIDDQGTYYFTVDRNNSEQMQYEKSYSTREWFKIQDQSISIMQIFNSPCSKLYKATVFKNISFPPHQYCEDSYTIWKLFLNAQRISFLNVGDYCWRIRKNSATENKQTYHLRNIYINWVRAEEEKKALYQEATIHSNIFKGWHDYLVHSYHLAVKTGNEQVAASSQYKLRLIQKYHLGK